MDSFRIIKNEGISTPVDSGFGCSAGQRQYIEAQWQALQPALLLHEVLSGFCEALLFCQRDGCQRAAVAGVAAKAYFYDYEAAAVQHDQIEFAISATEIGANKCQAAGFQPASREAFALFAFKKVNRLH